MIKINCSQNNFRRGGIAHPAGESFYPEDHFSPENLELIKTEPKLMVQTGLEPTGPETASMAELKETLKTAGIEFTDHDPRHLMVSKLISFEAQAKEQAEPDQESKTKKTKAAE